MVRIPFSEERLSKSCNVAMHASKSPAPLVAVALHAMGKPPAHPAT